jgi:hypothetical protein
MPMLCKSACTICARNVFVSPKDVLEYTSSISGLGTPEAESHPDRGGHRQRRAPRAGVMRYGRGGGHGSVADAMKVGMLYIRCAASQQADAAPVVVPLLSVRAAAV